MPVLSELATMTQVAQGTSLARFGHGELLIMWGEKAEHQKYDRRLDIELGQVIGKSPCLVAVPPNDPPEWRGFLKKYGAPIRNERWYGSSFVSRHDWTPWTEEYRDLMRSFLGNENSLIVAPDHYTTEHIVHQIVCPAENAYDKVDNLEGTITRQAKQLNILCCGPTATVLADRLARKGIWAVDLGNFGKFL